MASFSMSDGETAPHPLSFPQLIKILREVSSPTSSKQFSSYDSTRSPFHWPPPGTNEKLIRTSICLLDVSYRERVSKTAKIRSARLYWHQNSVWRSEMWNKHNNVKHERAKVVRKREWTSRGHDCLFRDWQTFKKNFEMEQWVLVTSETSPHVCMS